MPTAVRSGAKLDFLSQELNRESNTLCSKANDLELTNHRAELKAVVEPVPPSERCRTGIAMARGAKARRSRGAA